MKIMKKSLLIPVISTAIAGSLLLSAAAFSQQIKNESSEQQDVDLHASAVNLNNTANAKDLDFNGFSKLPKKVYDGPRSADYAVALRNGNTAYINENKQITIIDENGNQIFESNLGINDTTIPLQIITNDYYDEIWYMFAQHNNEYNRFMLCTAIFNLEGKKVSSANYWLLTSLNFNTFNSENASEWYIKPIYYYGHVFIYRKYTNTIYVFGMDDKNILTLFSTLTFPTYHNGDRALNIFGFRSVLSNHIYFVVLNTANNNQRFERIATYNFYDTNARFLGSYPIYDGSRRIWDVIYGNGRTSLDVPQNMGFAYDEDDDNGRIRLYFFQSFVATKGNGTNLILTAAAFSVNDRQNQGIDFRQQHNKKVWVVSNPSREYDYGSLPRSIFSFKIASVSHYRQIRIHGGSQNGTNNDIFDRSLLNPIITFSNFSGGNSHESGKYLTKELLFWAFIPKPDGDIWDLANYGNSFNAVVDQPNYAILNASKVVKDNEKPVVIAPYTYPGSKSRHDLRLLLDRKLYGNAYTTDILHGGTFSVSKNITSINVSNSITLNKYASDLTEQELKNLILQNLQYKIVNSGSSDTVVTIISRNIRENKTQNPTAATISLRYSIRNYFDNNQFQNGVKELNTTFNVTYQNVGIISAVNIKINNIDVTTNNSNYEVDFDSRVKLSAVVTTSSSIDRSRLRYKWLKDNIDLNNTNDSYTINKFTFQNDGLYKVQVWIDLGNNSSSRLYNEFQVRVRVRQSTAPLISAVTLTSNTSNLVNPNTNVTLKANVDKKNIPDGKIRYKWYKNGSLLSNNNSSNYIINNFLETHAGDYRVEVVHNDYQDIKQSSNVFKLQLNKGHFSSANIDVSNISPTIGQQYTLTARWTDPSINQNKLSFKWQKSSSTNQNDERWEDVTDVNNNQQQLRFNSWTEANNGSYRVKITYKDINKTVISPSVRILTNVDASEIINSVSLQTTSTSDNITYKTPVVLTANVNATQAVDQSKITYEWYKNDQKIASASGMGESFKTYTIKQFTTNDNGQYKVIAKYKKSQKTQSNLLSLELNQLKMPQINDLQIEAEGLVNNKADLGQRIKLIAKYDLVAIEQNQLAFNWTKLSNQNSISTSQDHTFQNFSVEDIGYYQLEVSHRQYPEIKSSSIIYIGINNSNDDNNIVVNGIDINADNQIAKYGSTVRIVANVISNRDLPAAASFQWKFKAKGSNQESNIENAHKDGNQSILTIENFDKTKAGTYSVELNFNNRVYKQLINIEFEMYSEPEVKSVLISADKSTVEYNSSTIIDSSIYFQGLNQSQLHYQWYKDNQPIQNETASTLYLSNIVTNSTYQLEVWSDVKPNQKIKSNSITINLNQHTQPVVREVILTVSSTAPVSGSRVMLSANVISNLTNQDLMNAKYTFKKDNVEISGLDKTKDIYIIDNIDSSKNGSYTVEVTFDKPINGKTLQKVISEPVTITIDNTNKVNINDVSIITSSSKAQIQQNISLEANLSINNIDNASMDLIEYKWDKKVGDNWVEIIKGLGESYRFASTSFSELDFGDSNYVEIRLTATYSPNSNPITKVATTKIYRSNVADFAVAFDTQSPFIVENYHSRRDYNPLQKTDATYFITQNQKAVILPNLLLDSIVDENLISYEWAKIDQNNVKTVISNNKSLIFNSISSSDFGLYQLKVKFNNNEIIATIDIKKNDILPAHLEPKIEANTQASNFFVSTSAINKENAINYLSLKNIDANEIIIDEVKPNDFLGTVEITYHLKSDNNNSLKAENSFTVTISGFFSILNVVIGITAFIVMIILIILLGIYFVKWKAKHQPLRLVYRQVPRLMAPVEKNASNFPQQLQLQSNNKMVKPNTQQIPNIPNPTRTNQVVRPNPSNMNGKPSNLKQPNKIK